MNFAKIKRKIRRLKNITFKKKYFHNYTSHYTLIARKLLVGFFETNHNHFNHYHILSATGKVRGNTFIITIVTDRPGALIGKGGNNIDLFRSYVERSNFFTNNNFIDLKINILESNYWPTSFEQDKIIMERDYNDYISDYYNLPTPYDLLRDDF